MMTGSRNQFASRLLRRGSALALAGLLGILSLGCSESKPAASAESSEPVRGLTIAVAPVMNFSGQPELDPVRLADLLASELTDVEGVAVLPVNRVVAYLASTGRSQIDSPAHAVRTAEAVGADAILVAGITEYDAYTPVVGVVLQMYARSAVGDGSLDVVQTTRAAFPAAARSARESQTPVGQVQSVYNATHETVVEAVKAYAKPRCEEATPFGWRQYLKIQTLFIRFCWHDALRRLTDQTGWREAREAFGHAQEMPA